MTESKSPELEDEFMEYFKVTKFKTQRTSAEIIADFTKIWSNEDCFFLAASFEVASFHLVHLNLFPFAHIGLDQVLAMMRY